MSGDVAVQARPTDEARPHARLHDAEAEYLALTGVAVPSRWALVHLRVRVDGRTGTVRDRIETLARQSGLSPRAVQSALADLAERGLITRTKSHAERGGGRGHAWSWTTTPLPYDTWPVDRLARVIGATLAYVRVFHRDEHAPDASSSGETAQDVRAPLTKSTHRTSEEDAQDDARARTTTRDIPESYSRDLSRERRALLLSRWKKLRLEHGHPEHRFIDRAAVVRLGRGIDVVIASGERIEDVERAIDVNARQRWADPQELGDWVAAERSEREGRESTYRRERERAEAEEQRAAATEADWQELERRHPGRTRGQIVDLVIRGELRLDDAQGMKVAS